MRTRSVRVLLAVLSLTLVLPAGWCCTAFAAFATSAPQPTAPSQPAPDAGDEGCPRCRREQPQPTPVPESEQKPAPASSRCGPCCDRDLATPPDAERLDDVAALPVPFAVVFVPDAGVPAPPVGIIHLPTGPPLHVRLCVWLC